MIFPSSGQTVHNVLLSFPDKNEGKRKEKKVPKLIRTDSEKCIPVTEVENTNEGAKLKFVHNGIRMVVYDDSKLSKQQVMTSSVYLRSHNVANRILELIYRFVTVPENFRNQMHRLLKCPSLHQELPTKIPMQHQEHPVCVILPKCTYIPVTS